MKRMLAMYGHMVVGLDATYKTTKYGLPLFLLVVKTNDGRGYPAAVFLVEKEDRASIAEALKLIADSNPNWRPNIIMVDKSDAEIGKNEYAYMLHRGGMYMHQPANQCYRSEHVLLEQLLPAHRC
jgi:hypothetical protein